MKKKIQSIRRKKELRNKKILKSKILPILLFFAIFLAIVYANPVNDQAQTLNQAFGPTANDVGISIIPNYNLILVNVSVGGEFCKGLKQVYLQDSNHVNMSNATLNVFAPNVSVFSQGMNRTLYAGRVYYLIANAEGSAYTGCKRDPTAPNTPINKTNIAFNGAWSSGVDEVNVLRNVENVTTDTINVDTNLITPTSSFTTASPTIIFNSSIVPHTQVNITNATLFVWYSNGTLFNRTTNQISGTSANSTIWNITLPSSGVSMMKWNVFGCGIVDTIAGCSFNSTNLTFNSGYNINNVSYSTEVYETSRENISINLSLPANILTTTAFLVYNNTGYNATPSNCASTNCQFIVYFDEPLTNVTVENSFFWNISIFDGTSSFSFLSSTLRQNVTPINLYNCTGPSSVNISKNFTAYDEVSLNRINPYNFQGTFQYWLGNGLVREFFSISKDTNEMNLCINPTDRTYHIEASFTYNGNITTNDYLARNYYYQNATWINNSEKVSLYLLNQSQSTSFILSVIDNELLPVNDSLIFINRCSDGTGTCYTVQIARTDNSGQSIGFFQTETVDYQFVIIKNGQVLLSTEKRKVFPQTAPYTINFRVGDALPNPFNLYANYTNLQYSLSYDNTTNTVSYTFIDTSGASQYGQLLVQLNNPSGTPTTICNTNTTNVAAVLSCNLAGYNGTFVAKAYAGTNPVTLIQILVISNNVATQIFGNGGLIWGFLIVATVALMFSYFPIVQIIAVNITVIIISLIGLVTFSPIYIFGMMAVSTIVLIVLRL